MRATAIIPIVAHTSGLACPRVWAPLRGCFASLPSPSCPAGMSGAMSSPARAFQQPSSRAPTLRICSPWSSTTHSVSPRSHCFGSVSSHCRPCAIYSLGHCSAFLKSTACISPRRGDPWCFGRRHSIASPPHCTGHPSQFIDYCRSCWTALS